MDLYCPRCAEPWALDELHGVVEERHDQSEWYTNGKYDQDKYDVLFRAVRKEFRSKGCWVFRSRCDPDMVAAHRGNHVAGEVMDLLGDDIDGAASFLDDARQLGLF